MRHGNYFLSTFETRKITGIDISEQMLKLGRKKVEKEGLTSVIELQTGDSETINFADNSFDAVTVAFGVRNFENLGDWSEGNASCIKAGR